MISIKVGLVFLMIICVINKINSSPINQDTINVQSKTIYEETQSASDDDNGFKSKLCKQICARDPSKGGTICNCGDVQSKDTTREVQSKDTTREVAQPIIDGSGFKGILCTDLCAKDPSVEGTTCNCNKERSKTIIEVARSPTGDNSNKEQSETVYKIAQLVGGIDENFKKRLCKKICAKDPSKGKTICNCNKEQNNAVPDPSASDDNDGLKSKLCKQICARDPSKGGTICNCDNVQTRPIYELVQFASDDDNGFKSKLCKQICARDPSKGGTTCNCDKIPMLNK